jgi:hypothetical protein
MRVFGLLKEGRSPFMLLCLLAVYVACWGEKEEKSYDLLCPSVGGSCENATGVLKVGAAKRDITPTITETFRDCGADKLCPGDVGYTEADSKEHNGDFDGHPTVVNGFEAFDDVNGNGYFDAVWIAGYGNSRPAQGVHDPIWARAVVIEKGDTTLAWVSLDFVGYFFDEVERLREEIKDVVDVDLLMVSATHNHEGPDTVGIWGYDEGSTGVDTEYMTWVRQEVIQAVKEAYDGRQEALAYVAKGESGGHPNSAITQSDGVANLIHDSRDPVVIDSEMRLLQFKDKADENTLVTVINWGNHPESLCDKNSYISSDFVHYLREAVEGGIDRGGVQKAGLGGMAFFVNAAVGGLLGPGHIKVKDLDATVIEETCENTSSKEDEFFNRARAFGDLLAFDALRILEESGQKVVDPDLSFATKKFKLRIENNAYHAMFLTGVFYGACETGQLDAFGRPGNRRCISDFDESAQVAPGNLPNLTTEVAVINFGPVQMVTVPGEAFPEWFIGGYDGSHTGPKQDLIDGWHNKEHGTPMTCSDDAACKYTGDPECEDLTLTEDRICSKTNCCCLAGMCRSRDYNPPSLDLAPKGPYLRDAMTRDHRWILGLTPDELGYIVPSYDFLLDERQPYIEDAPGDHYEETNSVGPQIGTVVEENLRALLAVVP